MTIALTKLFSGMMATALSYSADTGTPVDLSVASEVMKVKLKLTIMLLND